MNGKERNQPPDAAWRLWAAVDEAHKHFAANRRELGKLFWQLKNLYSERANSAARRLTSGHGVFQAEIKKRGYRPNRVREWICDYEVEAGLRPPAESTASKRKARRSNSDEYQRGYRAAIASTHAALEADPVAHFASLLPLSQPVLQGLKSLYRAALQELHPDHGGDEERTKALIAAWEAVEALHSPVADVEECVHVN